VGFVHFSDAEKLQHSVTTRATKKSASDFWTFSASENGSLWLPSYCHHIGTVARLTAPIVH